MVETYSPDSRHRIALSHEKVVGTIERMTPEEIVVRAGFLAKLMERIGRPSDALDLRGRRETYADRPTPDNLQALAFEVCWAESWL
jgi:hypothetical protein